MKTLKVLFSSPFFTSEENFISVLAETIFGQVEILPNHADFIAVIANGKVVCKDENGKERAFLVEEGLLTTTNNEDCTKLSIAALSICT